MPIILLSVYKCANDIERMNYYFFFLQNRSKCVRSEYILKNHGQTKLFRYVDMRSDTRKWLEIYDLVKFVNVHIYIQFYTIKIYIYLPIYNTFFSLS